ncbi:ParA family protein [Mucilaginibacter sp. SMC90]|uniref:ParA family protein n=1 Tax=Mucilaginibacter sp. SMC90 TaxID=2929803 RepID=UPI001FB555E0|nr:ParA family protein [Mucilaginibacter sp. SMC90]UOE52573.1 ParA family protein [Mucilaginibacter sp. SMC90]
MTIIIGNQKGGAGKSTITLVLANYLTQAKKCPVTVIDMDYQQSISQKYEKAKILENREPYEVLSATLETFPILKDVIMKNDKDVVLIDLPGKLDDDGLLAVFNSADLFICPFAYDEFTFESTMLFTVVLRKVNPKIKMVFIPNRIKANARYEIMLEVNAQLSKFGVITEVLPDRIDFQRTNTFQTPMSLYPVIIPVFEKIYADYLYGKHEIAG